MRENRTIRACKNRVALLVQASIRLYDYVRNGCAPSENSEDTNIESDNRDLDCKCTVEQDVAGDDIFTVKIRGKIRIDKPDQRVNFKIFIDDITDLDREPAAVYIKPKSENLSNLKNYQFTCDIGRLNEIETQITDWLSIAKIKPSAMLFARSGKRTLHLNGTVVSLQNQQFTKCKSLFEYENCELGYIDITQNIERSRALAVALAFDLCAADGKMYKSEINKIKDWAFNNIAQSNTKTKRRLEKALNKTVRFFKKGYKIDTVSAAAELARIAPAAQRYEIIEMFLVVVSAKEFVSNSQIEILKKLAGRLNIEPAKFREMAERLIPAQFHKIKDVQILLGIDEQMTKEQTRTQLNSEYRKWNSRVTNIDPVIQSQAEQMLNLIALARGRYVG
ncbi:MAG: TerB family tellurite resistance protein [Phycisphaerae bacterium]